jgi:hypothetical protein
MIQIDDAGWGSPIGGVLIAGYRPETGEFAVAEIAVAHFQPPRFQRRTYLDGAVDATRQVLDMLASPADERVEICSGFVHGKTHAWLAESGRPWEIIKVKGPLQQLIEDALANYLRGLGFEPPKSTEQYGALFYQAIKWLKDGNLNRAGMNAERLRVAKTGWASFPFYRDYPYTQAKALARRAKNRRSLARLRAEEE